MVPCKKHDQLYETSIFMVCFALLGLYNLLWLKHNFGYGYQFLGNGHNSGALRNIGYLSEIHLKLKSREISFAHNSCFDRSLWNFAQSTAVSLPCSVQNFKLIGQLQRKLWTNEFSRDLSLRWVSDGYPILHSTPGFKTNYPTRYQSVVT